MNTEPIKSNLQEASNLLKAMSNEHRLLILCNLVEGEKTVRELEELVGLRQTTLSQHLARLRYEGLVTTADKTFIPPSPVAKATSFWAPFMVCSVAGTGVKTRVRHENRCYLR